MMKECAECGKMFEARSKRGKYCSEECRQFEKTSCNHCGEPFVRKKYLKSVPYCSDKCRGIGKGTVQLLKCGFCQKNFTRQTCFVNRAETSYCSTSCQHKGTTTTPLKICERCGKEYKDIGTTNRRHCSLDCRKVLVPKENLEKYYIEQGLSAEMVGRKVGVSESSVFKSLIEFNIPTRDAGNAGRLLCKDGHEVSSSYEKIFDDKLTENNLEHQHDTPLPFHERYRTDFLIEDVYVEIWGIVGSASYDRRRKTKQKLYKENNCKLVNVYPEDFKDIDIKIEEVKRLLE